MKCYDPSLHQLCQKSEPKYIVHISHGNVSEIYQSKGLRACIYQAGSFCHYSERLVFWHRSTLDRNIFCLIHINRTFYSLSVAKNDVSLDAILFGSIIIQNCSFTTHCMTWRGKVFPTETLSFLKNIIEILLVPDNMILFH